MAIDTFRIPVAGGQYDWVAILAPKSNARFLSYITGWVSDVFHAKDSAGKAIDPGV